MATELVTWVLLGLQMCPLAQMGARAEPAREPVGSTPQDSIGPAFVLNVVDEAEKPVAGAHVRFVDLATWFEDSPWRGPEDLFAHELDGLCARIGKPYVSDAAGIVRIPKTELGGMCLAKHEGRAGLALFGRVFDHDTEVAAGADEEQIAVLADELVLNVRVTDGSGRPAVGFPVALRFREDGIHTVLTVDRQAKKEK